LDADDVALPDRFASQVAALDGSRYRACLSGWREIDDRGLVRGPGRTMHTDRPNVLRWSLCVLAGAVHSSSLFETEAAREVGGYADQPTSADLALWCTFARRSWLTVTDDVVVLYRMHDAQISQTKAETQRTWSTAVLRSHLEELTGERWDTDDARALRGAGRWETVPFDRAFVALRRWEAAWSRDASLDTGDRRELRRIGARVRLRLARRNAAGPADYIRTLGAVVGGMVFKP
jgi:hypothetical protein